MINTPLTRKAMKIAYQAHMNQFDKAHVPYIYHPIHLAEQMDSELECVVALLHDVVEDTNMTFSDLEEFFPSKVIEILKLLTRDKTTDYMEYIKKLKSNQVATKVKIADILHNSDETRLDVIDDEAIQRRKKYQEALIYLKKS